MSKHNDIIIYYTICTVFMTIEKFNETVHGKFQTKLIWILVLMYKQNKIIFNCLFNKF